MGEELKEEGCDTMNQVGEEIFSDKSENYTKVARKFFWKSLFTNSKAGMLIKADKSERASRTDVDSG